MQGMGVVLVALAPVLPYRLVLQLLAIHLVTNAIDVVAQLIRERRHHLEIPLEAGAEIGQLEEQHAFTPYFCGTALVLRSCSVRDYGVTGFVIWCSGTRVADKELAACFGNRVSREKYRNFKGLSRRRSPIYDCSHARLTWRGDVVRLL